MTIEQLKDLETPGTPLLLYDCRLVSGYIHRWSTHNVVFEGMPYAARILKQASFELMSSSDEIADGVAKLVLTLANADSFFSGVERTVGWKNAQLTVRLLFYDFTAENALTDSQVVFRGIGNAPEESTESTLKLSFNNRLSLLRISLPDIHIRKTCTWGFPADERQRKEAVTGGEDGKWSPFYKCGYSADQVGGRGNLNGTTPFTSCDYTRINCEARGMFDKDSTGNITRRFGGIEFVPPSIAVRGYGEKLSHLSTTIENQGKYNDCVPLAYGTGWYDTPVIFARNDGNLIRMEVLLGAGEISAVHRVLVNDVELGAGVAGTDMTATGWYNIVTTGSRTGAFNLDFTDAGGNALGDPYGSMAVISVVVPTAVSSGRTLPKVRILLDGLMLARYDAEGQYVDDAFTNNPAWVLLDVLRRSGWSEDEIDLASFYSASRQCDELVETKDINGNTTLIPKYRCNLILASRRSASDVVRGIRNCAGLYLVFDSQGRLCVRAEGTIGSQQPTKPPGSNSAVSLNSGWPAYEFGDSTFSGIVRRENGEASLRVFSRPTADTPNKIVVEFQDEFNEFQQDSLSLVDIDDIVASGQTITASLPALGLPNCDQATRIASIQLKKSVRGNTYVEFGTSVRAASLKPGDIITITYAKEGFDRQPFRLTRISPGAGFRTCFITAQLHDDAWYLAGGSIGSGTGRQPNVEIGLPRPLVGSRLNSDGSSEFDITETSTETTDGVITTTLKAGFCIPATPVDSKAGPPLVGLKAQIDSTGGTFQGGQTLYYGISGVDSEGAEGRLSFLARAAIPFGTSTNRVTLFSLCFTPGTTAFHVYRGSTPTQLLRVADQQPLAFTFTDSGVPAQPIPPPDSNFDHANFYWRPELLPESTVDLHSLSTIGSSTLNMVANEYAGAIVRLTTGRGAGQERNVLTNSSTTLSLTTQWAIEPDTTSVFALVDSVWQFGASGSTSPISFNVPNREGLTIEIAGKAANIRNEEANSTLAPITRWRIIGEAGSGRDLDIPPSPIFALFTAGQGRFEVNSISFAELSNTKTVSAGTLTCAYWDELDGSSSTLAAAIANTDALVTLSSNLILQPNDLIQIDNEILVIQALASNATYEVGRGSHGTSASEHPSAAPALLLKKRIFIMPFGHDFFGSPASGSYSYPVALPNVRIAAAELFVTNSRGNSDVTRLHFTSTADRGLRTLSGGQLTLQVQGLLAIQSNAVPLLVIEASRSVRDVFAVVADASTGTPIQLQVTQDAIPYCALEIPAGATISEIVNGASLAPLRSGARVGLNIVSVSQTSDTLPGRDLTVIIRL